MSCRVAIFACDLIIRHLIIGSNVAPATGGVSSKGGGVNYFHQKQLYADVIQAALMLRYNKRSRMKV